MAANTYAVLLRGVNVGGNRRVPKADFKKVLEDLGCTEVVVYLNSGNAVCASEQPLMADSVQKALEEYFGFSVPTLVLSAKAVQAIAAAIPLDWSNDSLKPDKSGQKSDVLYLFSEADSPDILNQIGYNPEIETMRYVKGAVLANISRANQAKGSLQKLIGKKLYNQITIRNINTAKKLAELVSQ